MYVALKPFAMSGVGYLINDPVNVDGLTDSQIASLLKKRYIAKADANTGATIAPLSVPIIEKDETIFIELSQEQLTDVFTVLQSTAEAAADIIKAIESDETLIVIHKIDSRKTVKEAAKSRSEELSNPKDGEE